jgi:hypothetical protein
MLILVYLNSMRIRPTTKYGLHIFARERTFMFVPLVCCDGVGPIFDNIVIFPSGGAKYTKQKIEFLYNTFAT